MNDTPERRNFSQAAAALGRDERTIRRWVEDFGIPYKVESGVNTLSPEMFAVLEQIKAFRDMKLDQGSIKMNIREALEQEPGFESGAGKRAEWKAPDVRLIGAELRAELQGHSDSLAESINQAHKQTRELTQQLFEAGKQIGEQQAQLSLMGQALQEARQQAKLLPEKAESLRAAEQKAADTARELQRARESRAESEARADAQIAELRQLLTEAEAWGQEQAQKAEGLALELAAVKAERDKALQALALPFWKRRKK